jgi:phage shock protein C
MTKRYKSENWNSWENVYETESYVENGHKKLRRNKIDGVLGGVCSGFGDYFGIDHTIMRIAFVLSVIFLGIPLFFYFLFWLFIPKDKRAPYRREYREARRARRKQRENPEEALIRTASFRDVKSKFRSLETRLQDLERSITSKEWKLRRDFRDLEG